MSTLLLIEDDTQIRRSLAVSLETAGYTVLQADCAGQGLALAAGHNPDAMILDLGLPDRDGKDVIRAMRTLTNAPIIVLSARNAEAEKVAAFEAGANDYMTKPFGTAELLARIGVALRNFAPAQTAAPAGAPESSIVTVGDLCIDPLQHSVTLRGDTVKLTPKEFSLLWQLAQKPGQLLTHNALMEKVWGKAHQQDTHYLRIYIAQLRRKIELDPGRDQFIVNEPGVGYRLSIPSTIQ
jgi:two-component system, OmpR family, KDP operon response regulator KdpE